MPSPPLPRSSMHLFTTWYHWTSRVSAGTSDGRKLLPRTSSFHFFDLHGSDEIDFGLVSRLVFADMRCPLPPFGDRAWPHSPIPLLRRPSKKRSRGYCGPGAEGGPRPLVQKTPLALSMLSRRLEESSHALILDLTGHLIWSISLSSARYEAEDIQACVSS